MHLINIYTFRIDVENDNFARKKSICFKLNSSIVLYIDIIKRLPESFLWARYNAVSPESTIIMLKSNVIFILYLPLHLFSQRWNLGSKIFFNTISRYPETPCDSECQLRTRVEASIPEPPTASFYDFFTRPGARFFGTQLKEQTVLCIAREKERPLATGQRSVLSCERRAVRSWEKREWRLQTFLLLRVEDVSNVEK